MHHAISQLSPLKKQVIAFLLGILSTLAMPPLFLWPVLFITLPIMIWMLDSIHFEDLERTKKFIYSAGLGWSFGFGFFITSLYWIGSSFLVEADKFAWALPIAVTLLPAGLAIFYSIATALTTVYWPKGPVRIIIFACLMLLVESLRSIILTGFPWNLLGHSLTGNIALMQSVTLFGVYGLTAIACYIFASPALLINQEKTTNPRWQKLIPFLVSIGILGGLYAYGIWHLSKHGPTQFHENSELIIIQPNIPQKEKVNPTLRVEALRKTLNFTDQILKERATKNNKQTNGDTRLILWPETAIPFAVKEAETIKTALANLLEQGDQLITGGYNIERDERNNNKEQSLNVFNSLFVIDDNGQIQTEYNKHHLVPFGEYLPFRGLLSAIGFSELVQIRGGFTKGKPPKALTLKTLPSFLPYICYEAIFPYSANHAVGKAGWLLNISNDSWFGQTAGPYQHAHMARLRTLETGLPMVRVVNGGISAVYDGLGRKVAETQLNQKIYLVTNLPKAVILKTSTLSAFINTVLFFLLNLVLISTMKFFDKVA